MGKVIKKFFSYKVLFVLIFILPILTIEVVLHNYPSLLLPFTHHRDWGYFVEIQNQLKKNPNPRVVVLGSSSTLFAVSSDKICNLLGLQNDTCIQASLVGGTPADSLALSQSIFEKIKPQLVIFGFDNTLFNRDVTNQAFYLGIKDYKMVGLTAGFNKRFLRFVFERISSIVEFQKDIKSNVMVAFSKIKNFIISREIPYPSHEISYFDFNRERLKLINPGKLETRSKKKVFKKSDTDEGRKRISNMLSRLAKDNIKILFVRIPMSTNLAYNDSIDRWLIDRTKDYVYYVNPRKDLKLENEKHFIDDDHMSEEGREIVSKYIVKFIEDKILQIN